MKNKIIIVDYEMGNVSSIRNMFKHIGFEALISRDPKLISTATHLVLAGVGAFDAGMKCLQKFNLVNLLNEQVLHAKVPILGICLGMQLMSLRSEEGIIPGLGWISGETIKFRLAPPLKIPHMGWNSVSVQKNSKLVSDLPDDARFYFVHSYYCKLNVSSDVLMTSIHGDAFVSALERDNLFGVQFHPEKSHKFGMRILKNFANIQKNSVITNRSIESLGT